MRTLILALALIAAAPAQAQIIGGVLFNGRPPADATAVTEAQAASAAAASALAAVAALDSRIPVPADSVPPTEMIGGAAGSAATFRRGDAANPRITRAAVVTTDAAGAWSVTWTSPLMAVPVVLPIPVNTTTQPVVCNVATRTTTGATGKCWLARTLPATLVVLTSLVTYDVFGGAASSTSVQVLAIPPTQ